ncbi:MAG: AraC family transcriptional regulator ligand-binding domain-containing protein [Pseudomonadota bacterium]
MEYQATAYVRAIIREYTRRGATLGQLLEGTELTAEQLTTLSKVSVEDYDRILSNLYALEDDPALGLKLIQRTQLIAPGVAGTALLCAPNLRAALRLCESFSRIASSHLTFSLRSSFNALTLTMHLSGVSRTTLAFHVEGTFLLLKSYIERLTGWVNTGLEFRFNYPAPCYADQYASAFDCPVVFDAQEHAIVLSDLEFDAIQPFYDRELWEYCQAELTRSLKSLQAGEADTWSVHVASFLRSFEPPLPDLTSVSEQMHISKRTLNRRLSQEGANFKQIRTDELNGWARRYLKDTDASVEAVALRLGYQDVASFRRAFKAWEGCSPAEFRSSARLSSPG